MRIKKKYYLKISTIVKMTSGDSKNGKYWLIIASQTWLFSRILSPGTECYATGNYFQK